MAQSAWASEHPGKMTTTPAPAPLAAPPRPDRSARWALFLDLDGTLVGFSDDPAATELVPGTLGALRALDRALDGALAIVSGRALDDLDRLLGDFRPATAGKHGHEWRAGDRSATVLQPPRETLEAARAATRALAAALPGVRLEDKGTAFALHYRERPEHQAAVLAGAERIVGEVEQHFVVQRGDHVVELLPPGADKGRALAKLMSLPPFARRTPVAIGDDLTDEHMFEAAASLGGFGIVVGARRPTAARFALADPDEVVAYLAALAAEWT
jgi:trehalose 6-phosphate phosphatase